jgi:uncharacterized protein (UPF0262 family)
MYWNLEPETYMPYIAAITLDDASIIRRTPEVEHERRVAMADLVEENDFALKTAPIASDIPCNCNFC